MYASIRKYKTDAPGLVIPFVRNEFLPLIKTIPGFVCYYLISSDKIIIKVCRPGAEAAFNRLL